MPHNVAIEGAVGAGKTTLFESLQKHQINSVMSLNFINEPVAEFCSFGKGHNPLRSSYLRPVSDAAIAQLHMVEKTFENAEKKFSADCEINLYDRSVMAWRYFVKTHAQLGTFSPFVKDFVWHECEKRSQGKFIPDVVIYLDVPISLAWERIGQRQRAEEDGLGRHFLVQLQKTIEEEISVISPTTHRIKISHSMTPEQVTEQVVSLIRRNT